jgi:hypothetical protein
VPREIDIFDLEVYNSPRLRKVRIHNRWGKGGKMNGRLVWRAWAAICLSILLMGAIDQKTQNAIKIAQLLKKIEMHHAGSSKPDLTADVTERELNDFIGYRLAHEKGPIINDLKVSLLDDNHVQGKIILDAQRLNLALLFGEKLNFDFKGRLQTRRGAARLDLDKLLLAGQPVHPQMLDMVLGAIALSSGTEPSRVDDWYPLPKGIDRITVKKGKATVYY